MKEFSDYEKKILRELIRVDETIGGLAILGNIIDFELSPNFYIELKSEKNCPVRIAKTFIDNLSSEYGNIGLNETMKQFNNNLLFIVKLFEYLELEDLIYLRDDFPITTLGTTFDVSETPIGYELRDAETMRLLYHYSRKEIVPSTSLIKFVKNNFEIAMKNTNDIQPVHDKEAHKLLKWSLIITAIGVVLTVLFFVNDHFRPLNKMNENNKPPLTNEVEKNHAPNVYKDSSIRSNAKDSIAKSPKVPNDVPTTSKKYVNPKNKKDHDKQEIMKKVMDKFKKI